MNARFRRAIISLAMEIAAEVIPISLIAVIALIHGKEFPFTEIVGLSAVLLVAFGFLMLTYGDFWCHGRPFDATVITGVFMGLIVFGLIAIGSYVHFLQQPLPDLQLWFRIQLFSAAVSLIYAACARVTTFDH